MTTPLFHACLVAALRGAPSLTATDLSDLVAALARLPVDELPVQVATDCYHATRRALSNRELRADIVRDLRRLATRLAGHVQQLDKPAPNGRVTAALERQKRRRDEW